jgi:hypothetical protein
MTDLLSRLLELALLALPAIRHRGSISWREVHLISADSNRLRVRVMAAFAVRSVPFAFFAPFWCSPYRTSSAYRSWFSANSRSSSSRRFV